MGGATSARGRNRAPARPVREIMERVPPGPLAWWQKAIGVAALALAVIGMGLSAYLVYENLQGQSGVCAVVHGCQEVQQSRYGKILGVPVSVPGFIGYAMLATFAVGYLRNFRGLRQQIVPLAFLTTLFGFLFSMYLTYVEGWVLESWCIYCIVSASLMTTLFVGWMALLVVEERARNN